MVRPSTAEALSYASSDLVNTFQSLAEPLPPAHRLHYLLTGVRYARMDAHPKKTLGNITYIPAGDLAPSGQAHSVPTGSWATAVRWSVMISIEMQAASVVQTPPG